MAELNDAYAKVRTPELRAAYEDERRGEREGTKPVVTPPAPREAERNRSPRRAVIDFGRYKGWTIASVAREDPEYLRWLTRHSSGMRFRPEIEAALASMPRGTTATERVFGRR
jgi:hypothetical protein